MGFDYTDNGTRCQTCGRYCGVKYEYRGPQLSEVRHCDNCDGEVQDRDD